MKPLNLKCVVVGDGGVGKTSMLCTWATGKFPSQYVPSVFENQTFTIQVDGKPITVDFWDICGCGGEHYYRLRPISYPKTDVFILCFSVDNEASFLGISDTYNDHNIGKITIIPFAWKTPIY